MLEDYESAGLGHFGWQKVKIRHLNTLQKTTIKQTTKESTDTVDYHTSYRLSSLMMKTMKSVDTINRRQLQERTDCG